MAGRADPRAEASDGRLGARSAALPPKQRAAVALRFACDLPHARDRRRPRLLAEDAARRSLHEGMKRLREELA